MKQIRGGDVVTMNPAREVSTGGSVVVDALACVARPGVVDAHQHLTGNPPVRRTDEGELRAHMGYVRRNGLMVRPSEPVRRVVVNDEGAT